MTEFERIKTSELLARDIDMARFFLKYAKENAEYLLKKEDENIAVKEFIGRATELENELEYYFDLLKLELGIDWETIESKRAKKRRKRKNKKG